MGAIFVLLPLTRAGSSVGSPAPEMIRSAPAWTAAVYLHLHIAAGDEEGLVHGGHLNRAIISATAEIQIQVIDGEIGREFSEEIGLNLFKF